MKILSKLSIGAVAAGAIAAPSSAATTVTVDFNLANDGSGVHDITLGGNATPQYQYQTISALYGKTDAYFQTYPTSYYNSFPGPAQFPTPGSVTESGTLYIGGSGATLAACRTGVIQTV
jgi:hypothetical protein